ncbi:hypothetical protein O181_008187 [Austropuccinia psidii MF-1]|uniref:Integrase catalytic domain-containing protein n=1 Tax=Austropuccinia psidii MF-1 TaxID=1389203 RepID=A0A9Q3BNC3_9BASI|nr:hypothetical protein [Austropuccinia psidii MF-1]
MLGTKLAFYTAYHPKTEGLAKRMIQTMEDIIKMLCAYGMEYKDHEGYTHYWVTFLPAVYHRSITLTCGKRVEPPFSCGSPEEKSSNYPPHSQVIA